MEFKQVTTPESEAFFKELRESYEYVELSPQNLAALDSLRLTGEEESSSPLPRIMLD